MTIRKSNTGIEETIELHNQVLSMIKEGRESISIIQIDRRPRYERDVSESLVSPGFERIVTVYEYYSIEARNRAGDYSDQATISGGDYDVCFTRGEKQLSDKLAKVLYQESLEIVLKLCTSGEDIIFSKRNRK